jgi:hypothetical protein
MKQQQRGDNFCVAAKIFADLALKTGLFRR